MKRPQWLHRWTIRHLPSTAYYALGRLYYRLSDWRRSDTDRPPRRLSFVYGYDPEFDKVGDEFLDYLIRFCRLQPDHAVLDVGCGIGRCALPLSGYLSPDGAYRGFDIRADGIAWCRKHIESRFPHFQFQHVDLANATYYPGGAREADRFRFPYEDAQFDVVFSKSVFTHLTHNVVAHYLKETHRVLKPGGHCLHTFFLLNEEALARRAEGVSQFDFRYPVEYGAAASRSEPEKAIAFEESAVRRWYAEAGLEIIEPIRFGAWSGRTDGLSGQDIIIARA